LAGALCAVLWIGALFGRLATPERVLATRDVPLFHLPLRNALRDLCAFGLPEWNPALHGGQPILSNPSYAAFYPPTWLTLALPPAWAFGLSAILHAAIAFGGAWWLARRLGCNRQAAALAAVAYSGSGAFLSLLSAFTLFSSLAWLPWTLAAADATLAAPPGGWHRLAAGTAAALALQLVNGEPSTVVMSGLGLAAVTAHGALRSPKSAPRILLPLLLALALAAVQLVPTLARLADSPRSRGLGAAEATLWSLPPARLVELGLPRFFGDPTRHSEGLFFGWTVNDRNFPYVVSLYPGLLLTLLALVALLSWRIPLRGVWVALLAIGLFIALGRHNPAFEPVRGVLPFLAVLRFPERFAALALAAVTLAGALGWHRLMEQREAGRRETADLPLALAGVWLATCVALTGSLYLAPQAARWYVRTHGLPGLPPAREEAALALLRSEGWAAVAVAAGAVALFALCRMRRPARRALELAALALVAGDLWRNGHGLVQTVPAETFRPPALLQDPALLRDRVFAPPLAEGAQRPFAVVGDRAASEVRSHLERLAPYAGLLWGVDYAFNVDYDLTLTRPARRAATLLKRQSDRRRAYRLLGAWNVGTLVLPKPPERLVEELRRDPRSAPVVALANPLVLPRYRLIRHATFHPDLDAAERAAEAQGFALERADHCVRAGAPEQSAAYSPARLLSAAERGSRILLTYRAEGGAFLVAAVTWDRGWRARVDGAGAAVYPTAVGQLGIELPPGEHRVELRYREPWLVPGAAVSLVALLACLALAGARRCRSRRIAAP
jgi:hypothetical protein